MTSLDRIAYKLHRVMVRCYYLCNRPLVFGILVGITFATVLFQIHVIHYKPALWSYSEDERAIREFGSDLMHGAFHALKTKHVANKNIHPSTSPVIQSTGTSSDVVKRNSSVMLEDKVTSTRLTKSKVFVGVITAEKFLATRSVSVYNTWGLQVDKIQFYSSEGSGKEFDIPVIILKGTSDNEYPPQKKAFEMLKHICTHHLDNFEWFIRADDDLYVRVELLRKLLAKIDSHRMVYMGQPGHGIPEVREKLGLNGHNFCMGGPGVIFNRNALKALCPYLDVCMREVVSQEEDVEIGRCVTNHLHMECTHAWETLKLFYHAYKQDYTEEKPFLGNLAENIHALNAITLHPLKFPAIMYRVHRHYANVLLSASEKEASFLIDEVNETSSRLLPLQQRHLADPSLMTVPEKPKRPKDIIAWKEFNVKSIYSASPTCVSSDITNDLLFDLKQIGESSIDDAISHTNLEEFTFSHIINGYYRSDFGRGTDYLFEIGFKSKRSGLLDHVRSVHYVRQLRQPEVLGVKKFYSFKSKDHPTYFVVIVPAPISKRKKLEAFMRDHYLPHFLVGKPSLQANLVVVPINTNYKNKSSVANNAKIEEVVNFYRNKYANASIASLPPITGVSDEKAATEIAYARGIVYTHQHMIQTNRTKSTEVVVLLTALNLSLHSDVALECALRTNMFSSWKVFSFNNSHTFNKYKSIKKKQGFAPHQIYQPLPFYIHPSSLEDLPFNMSFKADNNQTLTGNCIPSSIVTSHNGFWDNISNEKVGRRISAPLCGCLSDFSGPASAALESVNRSFFEDLSSLLDAGRFAVFRSPDRSWFYIPKR